MKRLAILFLLFSSSCYAQMMTQVSTIPYDGVNRTTYTFNLQKPTTLPCTMFLIAWGGSAITISDDANDVWETIPDGPNVVRGIWYTQCKGNAKQVKITFSSPDRFYGVLGEKAGYFDVDVVSAHVDGNSNPSASNTIVTTSSDYIIGYGWNYTTTTPALAVGSGYTMEGQAGAFLEDLQQTAPGPVSSSVAYGNGWSGWWVQGIVAFKPAIPDFCICNH